MSEVRWAVNGSNEAVAGHLAAVIACRNAFIGVPGGQTPGAILRDLSERPDLPWEGTTLTVVDDRDVIETHPSSNIGVLRSALSARGATIRGLREGLWHERLDLAWIGMGSDGHVASVFPSTPEGFSQEPKVVRTCPNPLPPDAPFERLTLTLGALCQCEEMILVIRGDAKRAVVEGALASKSALPIARLLGLYDGPLTIYWTAT